MLVVLAGTGIPAHRGRAIDVGAMVGVDARLPIAPLVLSEGDWDELVRRERLLRRQIERDGVAV